MQQETDYFQAVIETAVNYIDKLGIQAVECKDDSGSRLFLEDITAYVQVSGVIEGGLLLTFNDGLAQQLAHGYMLEAITDEEASGYAADVVGEITNIITANALTGRPDRDIFLGTPLMIVTKRAEVRSKSSRLLVQPFTTLSGKFQCIYIPTANKSDITGIFAVPAN